MVVKILTKIFIELPLYLVALAFPRRKDLWVFGAWFGNRYSDNSRYLFEYVIDNYPEIRAVWLTHRQDIIERLRREGKEAYKINSLKGFLVSCRAGVAVFCQGRIDVNRFGVARAYKVQLWHGSPLKKIGYDVKYSDNGLSWIWKSAKWFYRLIMPFDQEIYDIVIASSGYIVPRLASAFRIEKEKVVVTGYPRADIILGKHDHRRYRLSYKVSEKHIEWVILYAPTFRNKPRDIFEGLNWEKLNEILLNNNAVMLVKLHYVDSLICSTKDHRRIERFILIDDQDEDINYLLPQIDILVTDYSSVFFDFLLLNRPIVFFPIDFEDYIQGDRELYEDYNEATPGPKCKSWTELIEVLDLIMSKKYSDEPYYRQLRQQACLKYNKFIDTNNCGRVTKAIFTRIGLHTGTAQ